jgi:hypothetical protein
MVRSIAPRLSFTSLAAFSLFPYLVVILAKEDDPPFAAKQKIEAPPAENAGTDWPFEGGQGGRVPESKSTKAAMGERGGGAACAGALNPHLRAGPGLP